MKIDIEAGEKSEHIKGARMVLVEGTRVKAPRKKKFLCSSLITQKFSEQILVWYFKMLHHFLEKT